MVPGRQGLGLLGDNQNGILLAQQLDPTSNPERIIAVSTVRWVFDKPLLTDKELDQARERHIRPAPHDLLGWLRASNCQQYAPRHCVALYPITRGGGSRSTRSS